MAEPTPILRGVVHGRTIELEREPGLPDGQEVAVTVRAVAPRDLPRDPADSLRLTSGAWAEDGAELDSYLEWNRRQRKSDRPDLES